MNIHYNDDLKQDFINAMIKAEKSYVQAYIGLFSKSAKMEVLFNKDLAKFTSEDLLVLFKDTAKNLKYTTILSYNSLIKNYKDWVKVNCPNVEVVEETCTVEQLTTISNFRQYVIFNDNDINKLTIDAKIDGADYNSLIFLRLFWEIEGQESSKDICKLNIENVNYENKTVKLYNSKKKIFTTYQISNWLNEIIKEYADKERITFFNRHGDYFIGTAEENNGFVIRTTKSSKTNIDDMGKAITPSKMSNILHNYCNTKLNEIITINDLSMSLALRDMILLTKTPLQMYSEKRYFANISTNVYKNVLDNYGQWKYKDDYKTYVNMIRVAVS